MNIVFSLLSWQGPHGFSIPYPNISMHAISKDPTLYPTDCLYVMIDKHIKLAGMDDDVDEQSDDNDSDNESDSDISELIFVPEDRNANALAQMYEAIKQCQELHPDPADISTDEDEAFEDMMEDQADEDGDGDGDGDADVHVGNVQMQNLTLNEHQDLNGFRHVNNHNHMEDEEQEQFEDAD